MPKIDADKLPAPPENLPKKGEIYQHWKHGHLYRIESVARSEADPSRFVVNYVSHDAAPDEIAWSRSLEDFTGTVPRKGGTAAGLRSALSGEAAIRRFLLWRPAPEDEYEGPDPDRHPLLGSPTAKERDLYLQEWLVLDFTEKLLAFMKKNNVLRKELARRIGAAPSRVTTILKGGNVTLRTVARLANALGAYVRLDFKYQKKNTVPPRRRSEAKVTK